MRAGAGCSAQQALTPDAASIVKQSVLLARRRGHAQVTPLHVASTMLSSSSGLLRSACLKSHSHPLQCKALDLCFNVALNRLPSSGGPHHTQYPPSLSNALVAAFKRAQAHQRRGGGTTNSSSETQPPLLAVKIELEQLVVSILDDPSVSRVMREASFSSTQVKANVISPPAPPPQPVLDDVANILNSVSVKRSVAIVGETLQSTETAVKGLMERSDKEFVTLPLHSLKNLVREEVDKKVTELRRLVRSVRGVVLYLGDLSWAAEFTGSSRGCYCPVEHMMMEIRRMVVGECPTKLWVIGIATYQTYMRCKIGSPSLEAALGLHAITLPSSSSTGLELSLTSNNSLESTGVRSRLTCCGECSLKFENEARGLPRGSTSSHGSMITSTLPSWLQQYKEESNTPALTLQDLCKKWNSICESRHKISSEITLHFSSVSPSSSSICSYDHQPWATTTVRNSTSSSDTMEMEYVSKFKEINAENLKVLCTAMEKRVPWQKAIIPEIASAVLQCRSGMMRRRESLKLARAKEETWLFFQGGDVDGKAKIARELAGLIFGSHTSLVSIELTTFSSNSTDGLKNKRSRSDASHNYTERLLEAVRENPHRVFLVEDIEQVDARTHKGLEAAMERGSIVGSNGEEVSICDAIIILSCESFDSRSRACSPSVRQRMEDDDDKEVIGSSSTSVSLDLNLCAVDEEEEEEDCCYDGVGLLESVDRAFFFKLPEEL